MTETGLVYFMHGYSASSTRLSLCFPLKQKNEACIFPMWIISTSHCNKIMNPPRNHYHFMMIRELGYNKVTFSMKKTNTLLFDLKQIWRHKMNIFPFTRYSNLSLHCGCSIKIKKGHHHRLEILALRSLSSLLFLLFYDIGRKRNALNGETRNPPFYRMRWRLKVQKFWKTKIQLDYILGAWRSGKGDRTQRNSSKLYIIRQADKTSRVLLLPPLSFWLASLCLVRVAFYMRIIIIMCIYFFLDKRSSH